MKTLYTNARIYHNGEFKLGSLCVEDSKIVDIAFYKVEENLSFNRSADVNSSFDVNANNSIEVNLQGNYLLPGLVDVHVHLREPGYSYKETIKTGTMAAARGGYTTICSMPNLNPAPDNLENLKQQLEIIKNDAVIKVLPYACITKGQKGEGELVNFDELSEYAFAFSDDGRGVQNEELMFQAMQSASKVGKAIVAHCEVNGLLNGGYIHDGLYAKEHGHKGICSESEWKQVERDIVLAQKTDCQYHVCHISTKESVELIRTAIGKSTKISCETAPHYLLLSENDLKEEGRFKMNPPIRSESDKAALIQALVDGVIEIIATDHAPHSEEEKSKGLKDSAMGVVGLETAFPLLYTYLVKKNIITLSKLMEVMSLNPRRIFGLESVLEIGANADFCVWDLDSYYEINSKDFLSMGHATPFEGWKVYGKNLLTIVNGAIVYDSIDKKPKTNILRRNNVND